MVVFSFLSFFFFAHKNKKFRERNEIQNKRVKNSEFTVAVQLPFVFTKKWRRRARNKSIHKKRKSFKEEIERILSKN